MRAPIRLVPALLVLLAPVAAAGGLADAEKRSGSEQMSPEARAMQADDAANPGMLAVQDGADLWTAAPATGRPACAGCHGAAEAGMRGVAARYPAWDAARGAPIDLEGRIDQCRTLRQGLPALAPEGADRLGLTAYVALQSRGMPIAPPEDARLEPAREAGRRLFTARAGQFGLSCAACHDDNWGRRLGSAPIPQGHPDGYPLYRLEWQGMGSLQRRLRNCLTGMRAEPLPYGSPEAVALELYLMRRAAPLPMQAPAVRP